MLWLHQTETCQFVLRVADAAAVLACLSAWLLSGTGSTCFLMSKRGNVGRRGEVFSRWRGSGRLANVRGLCDIAWNWRFGKGNYLSLRRRKAEAENISMRPIQWLTRQATTARGAEADGRIRDAFKRRRERRVSPRRREHNTVAFPHAIVARSILLELLQSYMILF
jgi:hypothetical protein